MKKLRPVIRAILESSSGFDADRACQDIFELALYKRRESEQFQNCVDVLIVPSTVTRFTVAEIEEGQLARNRLMGSLTHLCAVAISTGSWKSPKGNIMSFGVTLIAEAARDMELMEIGDRISI